MGYTGDRNQYSGMTTDGNKSFNRRDIIESSFMTEGPMLSSIRDDACKDESFSNSAPTMAEFLKGYRLGKWDESIFGN
jgi:hypothetical protein